MKPFDFLNKKFFGAAVVLIIAAGLACYSNSFKVPYHFDDQLTIADNYIIKSLNNVDWLLLYDPSRFLTHLTFALNYHFGRLDVVGFHVVNLFLHILNALLVYVLLQYTFRLSRSAHRDEKDIQLLSIFAALLFVVHPLQTQAVTYIVQRSVLLASFCSLGAIILYLVSRQTQDIKFHAAAVALMLIGVFTKPVIVTLPLALVLYEVFFFELLNAAPKQRIKVALGLAPFFLLAFMVPLLIMTWKFRALDVERYWEMMKETRSLTRWEYLLTQFNVLMTYARLLFVPIHQNLDYQYPIAKSFFSFPTWISFSVLAGIMAAAVKMFQRQRLLAFGIFWMAVTLSLESSFFPIADVINEHRLYLAMMGFALVVGLTIKHFLKKREICITVMSLIIVLMGCMTYQRNIIWGDRVGMLKDIIKKSPQKARAYNNLGIAYAAAERLTEAEEAYQRAIALNPKFAHPHNNLANVYFKENRWGDAEAELQQALAIEPKYSGAYYNLGNLAWVRGDIKKAQEYYAKAANISPSFVMALVSFAKSCRYLKDFNRSEYVLFAAQKIDPTYEGVYVNLGDLYLTTRQYDKALRQYQIALRYTQQPAVMLNNIGNLYDMFLDFEQAKNMYKEAIWRDPTYPHSYYNLSNTLYKMGDLVQARIFMEKAAQLYARQGDKAMAERTRQRLQRSLP